MVCDQDACCAHDISCDALHIHAQAHPQLCDVCSLALQFGNGTLRLTTRQAYQLHGVLKQDLKSVFSTVIKNMGSTLGACGDVNRNVMAPPAPYTNRPDYTAAEECANDLADLLAPQSGAYYDVWLDGEKFATSVREVCLSPTSNIRSTCTPCASPCSHKAGELGCSSQRRAQELLRLPACCSLACAA